MVVRVASSSSHALIGGLCGATLASSGGQWSAIKWSVMNPDTQQLEGLWHKVVMPMVLSPVCGLVCGFMLMGLLLLLLRNWTPHVVNAVFGKLQILSASFMGFSHGTNDAQKTMGVIALTMFTATQSGAFNGLPAWLGFLKAPEFEITTWMKIVCAVTMASGTATGGYRIMQRECDRAAVRGLKRRWVRLRENIGHRLVRNTLRGHFVTVIAQKPL